MQSVYLDRDAAKKRAQKAEAYVKQNHHQGDWAKVQVKVRVKVKEKLKVKVEVKSSQGMLHCDL
jgi:hypothetical protein